MGVQKIIPSTPITTVSVPLTLVFLTPIVSVVSHPSPMDARYAPLDIGGQIHGLPLNYGQRQIQFDGTGYYTIHQPIDKLNDFTNLEEVDHVDVRLRLFA